MGLNEEQQTAVSHSEGQLLVRAGPGSGKTHIIIEKVNRLVAGGIPPESILCMTFTERAADEMRQRLGRGTGEVWVGTIHSLCLEILKDNRVKTGTSESTVVFGGLPRLAWCFRNMNAFGIDPDIVSLEKSPIDKLASMLKAVRLAKRELVSADDLERYTRDGLAATPDDEALSRLGELVKVYRAYDSHKNGHNLIDYDDMVAMTVDLFERDARVLETYRERYQHVLVDEFQDNNYAQFRLAVLLAGPGNITVVGDDDQSIMGFQGAFGGIFDEFRDAYPGHKSATLGQNYRCSGNISKLSVGLLSVESGRDTKPLVSKRPAGERVVAAATSDEESEREFVAKTILDLGVPHGKVAVLCRTNRSCQAFARALRASGIPAALVGTGNLMRNPLVAEIMALLRIAASPETAGDSISLVLSRRGIREYNIQAINRAAARLASDNGTPDDGVYATLAGYPGLDQGAEAGEILRQLKSMCDESRKIGLLGTLYRIMMEYTDAYKKNANAPDGDEDAAWNLAVLNKLYDVAEEYERHYYGRRLSDFVEYVELAENPDAIDTGAEYDEPAAGAVSVLTIHKSKGKEFDTVFVTGLRDDNMPGKPRADDFEIPKALLKGSGRSDDSDLHFREQRNLLYVAMTRAKNRLYLSYPKLAGDSRKEREPSRFLKDMKYESNPSVLTVEYEKAKASVPAVQSALDAEKSRIQEEVCKAVRESRPVAAVLGTVNLAKIAHGHQGSSGGGDSGAMSALKDGMDAAAAAVAAAMDGDPPVAGKPEGRLVHKETLTLSASGIEEYQVCPLKFKYNRILRIPSRLSMAMRKGTVIHAAMERLGGERASGRDQDVAEATRLAAEELSVSRGEYDAAEYAEASSSLEDIINNYAAWDEASPSTPVDVEVEFRLAIDDIRYKGKIDRLDRNPDGEYEVVDFKTGRAVITQDKLRVSPQANIYAHAVREKYGSLPAKVSMVYPAKDNKTREYAVTEESLEEGLDIVRDCGSRIIDEQFDPAPGFHCKWCPYNKICPAAK